MRNAQRIDLRPCHTRLDRVPLERDARGSGNGVAVQHRELVDHLDSTPVRRTALASAPTLAWLGCTTCHEISRYFLLR